SRSSRPFQSQPLPARSSADCVRAKNRACLVPQSLRGWSENQHLHPALAVPKPCAAHAHPPKPSKKLSNAHRDTPRWLCPCLPSPPCRPQQALSAIAPSPFERPEKRSLCLPNRQFSQAESQLLHRLHPRKLSAVRPVQNESQSALRSSSPPLHLLHPRRAEQQPKQRSDTSRPYPKT